MKIRVLFFAAHRDIVGTDETTAEVPEGSTVSDVIDSLKRQGQPWSGLPDSVAVAVNRTYSPGDTTLQNGDEVALIPPVAGG